MNQCASVPSVASWKTSHWCAGFSDSSDFSDEPIIIVISSISPIKTKSMCLQISHWNRRDWLRRAERFAEKHFRCFLYFSVTWKRICVHLCHLWFHKNIALACWIFWFIWFFWWTDNRFNLVNLEIKTKSIFLKTSRKNRFDKPCYWC